MTPGVSIRPSEMVEGGAVPVDRNLTWKECRFVLFDYQGKAPATTAGRIILVDDDGTESIQHYSAADPARFIPSADGKTIQPVGIAQSLSKSSNFHVLMNALVNAGFPENKITDDISALDGLYAYHIGMPEPKRSGLARPAQADGSAAREKILSIPSKILRLPWEKVKGGARTIATKATAKVAADEESGDDITAQAVAFIGKAVEESGSATRQDLAVRVFKDLAKDPNRDAIATLIFSPTIQATLLANGFTVKGETISK